MLLNVFAIDSLRKQNSENREVNKKKYSLHKMISNSCVLKIVSKITKTITTFPRLPLTILKLLLLLLINNKQK